MAVDLAENVHAADTAIPEPPFLLGHLGSHPIIQRVEGVASIYRISELWSTCYLWQFAFPIGNSGSLIFNDFEKNYPCRIRSDLSSGRIPRSGGQSQFYNRDIRVVLERTSTGSHLADDKSNVVREIKREKSIICKFPNRLLTLSITSLW